MVKWHILIKMKPSLIYTDACQRFKKNGKVVFEEKKKSFLKNGNMKKKYEEMI